MIPKPHRQHSWAMGQKLFSAFRMEIVAVLRVHIQIFGQQNTNVGNVTYSQSCAILKYFRVQELSRQFRERERIPKPDYLSLLFVSVLAAASQPRASSLEDRIAVLEEKYTMHNHP